MRYSQFLISTSKETPADAQVISHILMLRAGMIKKLASGIYNYLPLALKTIQKIETIIREEMSASGAVELLMPGVQPSGLWEESGRWDYYGPELLRFKDRKGTDFCLGPTHEEVITDIARDILKSYKDLPKNLFQIQSKFRDEIRPRFGLMRGREFIMKDGYSFDIDEEASIKTYWTMYDAYKRIFSRCGLKFKPVEAGTGAIGGTLSHEFQVLAQNGEDAILSCSQCEYAANIEKAELGKPEAAGTPEGLPAVEKISTPDQRTIEELEVYLNTPASSFIKSLVYMADEKPVIILIRGDYNLSEAKLMAVMKVDKLYPAHEEQIREITGGPVGFTGPINLKEKVTLYADYSVLTIASGVTGANEKDTHLKNVSPARDLGDDLLWADLREAVEGEPCPRCGKGTYELYRGIEAGQVFFLGTKYSERMNATVLDETGKARPMVMGCYGIGVTRTMAAAIEQNHDENGIIWPFAIAPFQVIICTIGKEEEVKAAGERLYKELLSQGIEVLLDDRPERPGFKFKDADLVGIPLRIVVGKKTLAEDKVELKLRREKDASLVPLEEAAARAEEIVRKELENPTV